MTVVSLNMAYCSFREVLAGLDTRLDTPPSIDSHHPDSGLALEGINLTFADEALSAIARKAIERKTGARGLRSIMEYILLDTMFELPSLEGVEEVVISKEVVEGTARPLYIYADRAGDAGAT